MYKNDIDEFEGHYVIDALSDAGNLSDRRAFQIGWSRFQSNRSNRVFDLLRSGWIPSDQNELEHYIGVYERGMNEVNDFMNQNN